MSQHTKQSGLPDEQFIQRMRDFAIDHEPEGWPAVKMKDITRLCDLATTKPSTAATRHALLIADEIEAGRAYDDTPEGRKLAAESIRSAVGKPKPIPLHIRMTYQPGNTTTKPDHIGDINNMVPPTGYALVAIPTLKTWGKYEEVMVACSHKVSK